MSKKTHHDKNENSVILAGIASFTIIVVAAIWFLSSAAEKENKNTATAKTQESQDGIAGHHSGNGGKASTAGIDALVGKSVPDFAFVDKDGKTYSKESLKGKKIVLFFNEGLMCYPACWEQIVQLASDNRLNNADTVVLSIVVDSAKDWQSAVKKMPELAKATVVFDTDKQVSNNFGVLTTPSSMHFGSLPGHSYVIIDREGIVQHVYDDPRMAIHNNQLVDELAKLK
ncbi:MAG: redoxin domain-containing protein [Candidatus Magasanikbacteria bacterium]|nr:redoxin domain-containing protein [Candidatus Magasanikbacteria bacterium]